MRQLVCVACSSILLVVVGGCQEPPREVREISVIDGDSLGISTVTISGSVHSLPVWSLAETPLLEISGDAEPFLGRVGQVAFLGDDGLLIDDAQSAQLRAFAGDGTVLRLLAGPGDGPGEIRALSQLSSTSGDTIYSFDVRQERITVFAPDGTLLTTIPIRPGFAGPGTFARRAWGLGSDRYLVQGEALATEDSGPYSDPPQRVVRDEVIGLLGEEGTEVHSPLRFPGSYKVRHAGGSAGSPFSNLPFVAVNADRILHGSGLSYELVVRDLDLQPTLVIRWADWLEPLTAARLEDLRAPMAASLHELRAIAPERADGLMDALFHPAVVPEALPALGTALLDENGRIWVQRFRPSEDLRFALTGSHHQWQQEDLWHVLDADGHPLAQVQLPPNTRLLAVRHDRVAVVTRDQVDVEHVRVLAIGVDSTAR